MNASSATFYNSTAETSTVTLMVEKKKKKKIPFQWEKNGRNTMFSTLTNSMTSEAKMEVVSHTVKEWRQGEISI